jgi:hypothetical protein
MTDRLKVGSNNNKKKKRMNQINELLWLEVDHDSKKIRNYKTGLMVSWEGKTGQALIKNAKTLIHPSQVPWLSTSSSSSSSFGHQKIKNR